MSSAPSRQDDRVRSQYDAWASIYDRIWARYVNHTLPVLERVAGVRAGERVLDLACGTGELERRMVDGASGLRIVGVDLAPAMVNTARSKLADRSTVQFERADAHDLPFETASFDVVVCANSFHYFTHPKEVLTEARRVLTSDGRLVLLDWCRDFWACRFMDAVLRWVDPAHHACYTLAELTTLLGASAFRVHDSFRYRFDAVWGMMVVDARPLGP